MLDRWWGQLLWMVVEPVARKQNDISMQTQPRETPQSVCSSTSLLHLAVWLRTSPNTVKTTMVRTQALGLCSWTYCRLLKMVVFSEHWRLDRYGLNMLNHRESPRYAKGHHQWEGKADKWEVDLSTENTEKTIQLQFFWKTSRRTSQHTFWCSSLTSKLHSTKLKIAIYNKRSTICMQTSIYYIHFHHFKTMQFCKGSFG